MLRLAIITVWTLMITVNQIVEGYTIGSRNRDYTNGYSSSSSNTSGFVGLSKDSQAELADQLSSSSAYISSNSQRYPGINGNSHSNSGSGYSSSTYADSAQPSGYTSHSSNTHDSLGTIASSYSNDAHGSSEKNNGGYVTGSTSDSYPSTSGGHGASTYSGYSNSHLANTAGLSTNDQSSSAEYNSVPSSTYAVPSSSLGSYVITGPKAAAYTASNHGHSSSPFASAHNFMSSSHSSFPGSSHSNTYPGSHLSSYPGSRHSVANYPLGSSHIDNPRFSASSLNNYISPHSNGAPSSFIHSSATPSHRGSIPPFLLSASSSISPSFSKVPSFYSSPSAFIKGGNKFIIIKENPANHPGLMHSSEPSFPSRMFTGSSGFKVKSTGPFVSGPHPGSGNFVNGLHLSSGYSGANSGSHSSGSASPYFTYQ